MKVNKTMSVAWASVVAMGFCVLGATSAQAELPAHPGATDHPVLLPPQFSCSVSFGPNKEEIVKVTKTGGAAVDKTKDVIILADTQDGKKTAGICGSQFPTDGSTGSVSVTVYEKAGYKYSCTASAGTTNFACNPAK